MWCRAGFQPDSFWDQTTTTFQACMDGFRQRMEYETESNLSLAWHMGAFGSAAQAGKLKPLRTYLKKPPRKMGPREMLANMNMLATRVNRKFGDN